MFRASELASVSITLRFPRRFQVQCRLAHNFLTYFGFATVPHIALYFQGKSIDGGTCYLVASLGASVTACHLAKRSRLPTEKRFYIDLTLRRNLQRALGIKRYQDSQVGAHFIIVWGSPPLSHFKKNSISTASCSQKAKTNSLCC